MIQLKSTQFRKNTMKFSFTNKEATDVKVDYRAIDKEYGGTTKGVEGAPDTVLSVFDEALVAPGQTVELDSKDGFVRVRVMGIGANAEADTTAHPLYE